MASHHLSTSGRAWPTGPSSGAFPGSGNYLGSGNTTGGSGNGGGGGGGGVGGTGWGSAALGPSGKEVLVGYIERACDPSLHEPNMSLDLEIADLINSRKGNSSREAAVEVVRLVNSRNTHVAMLALHLLDILVKNCGYAFHLQISTKDFLNELVRRFPERPPTFPPPPMKKVLELVHEWKNTICVTSRRKEDLVHIRDMHRLLSYKGYRFPDFDRRSASVLNPTESLQTPDELEEEDRAAQSAKLQELIRRGTPKDLAAAQELMKSLAGAEPDKKPNYEEQVAKELDRIQQRVLLLNEMLNNAKPKERFVEGDAYDQIAQKCRHVQPKLQKWIEESAENNPEGMDRLLLINDLINQVLARYEAFKGGNREATAEIDPALSSGTAAGSKAKQQAAQVSLIDFDDDDAFNAPAASSAPQAQPTNALDDLASLSLGSAPAPTTAAQSSNGGGGGLFDLNAAFGNPTHAPVPVPASSTSGPFFSTPSPSAALSSSSSAFSSSSAPQSASRPPPLKAQQRGTFFTNPSYGGNGVGGAGSRSSTPGTPTGAISLGGTGGGSMNEGQGQTRNPPMPPPVPPKKDAFEDLLGDF
ncbi:hypothetical protein JCM11641_006938 [Rhodosporidiobolus odoratus]